jgi:P27 family predicted phage terminase small subunit
MERGRPRKPKNQKLLEGTYRPDRDQVGIVAKVTDTIPAPPDLLSEKAAVYFRSVCEVLKDLNILSTADIVIITQLAQNLEMNWLSYREIVDRGFTQSTATGYEAISPAYTVFEKTNKTIRDLTGLLGLSPAARERIKIKPEEKADDDLTKILMG